MADNKKPPEIKIDCIPITVSNDSETVPVYTFDSSYSNSSAQLDFMKTVVIYGIVMLIICFLYYAVPFMYKSAIIENILESGTGRIPSINFIGGMDVSIAVILFTITGYNFIVGASSISENEQTDDPLPNSDKSQSCGSKKNGGNDGSGDVAAELDGYNKIIFAFVSGFFFLFSAFIIYNRKKDLLKIEIPATKPGDEPIETEEMKEYAKSMSMDNFKKVLSSFISILSKGGMPVAIMISALFVYYIILVILITCRGTDSTGPYWINGKFQGNDIITSQTFYDCLVFYPIILVIPVFTGIGYVIKKIQDLKFDKLTKKT